jgi:hypothetical protein
VEKEEEVVEVEVSKRGRGGERWVEREALLDS